MLTYALNKILFKETVNKLPLGAKQLSVYKNPNNDPRGKWRSVSFSAQGFRPNQMYGIESPVTGKIHYPPEGSCWKVIRSEYERLFAEDKMYFGKDGNAIPQRKQFLKDIEGIAAWTWWPHEEVGHTDESRKEIQEIFGTQTAFDTPKPTRLIERILQISTKKDSIILDSFAGSGTTAHAVLKQNAEDGGNRKFILVEMDQNIAPNVTAERVKRISQGYTNSKGQLVEGLGSGFQYCSLSEEPLFMANGEIRPDVTFAQLAEFVWFGETGTGYTGSADSPLLGVFEGRAIYLLYNGILKDLTEEGGNVLTSQVYGVLPKFDGAKVIYAAANRLGAKAKRENITFKQTPYELEV